MRKLFLHKPGFSLLEVLLTISLFAIFAVLVVPAFRGLLIENDLLVSQFLTAEAARQAVANSQAGKSDSGWGIALNGGNLTLFSGPNYGARTVASDTAYVFPPSITTPSPVEIDFAPFTGLASASTTIELDGLSGHKTFVTVNSQGIVSY